MRMIAKAAVFVAPLLVTSGLALTPALADPGSCLWGGTSYSTGTLVRSGTVVFSCSASSTGSDGMWVTAGQSSTAGESVNNFYDGNPGDYSPGATLADDDDNAWALGTTWSVSECPGTTSRRAPAVTTAAAAVAATVVAAATSATCNRSYG
jgi:hypothetical protein